MEQIFRGFMLLVMSEQCYSEFFYEWNFFHVDCLKATVSKGLGLAIIAGSTFVKIPQLLKIWRAKSAEGIQLTGVTLELIALSSAASYNYAKGYPFSAWGESLFLLLETAGIGFLVIYYSGRTTFALSYMTGLVAVDYALFSGLTPMNVLWSMQAANLPIVLAAKSVQALANYRQGHTGQLSGATVGLLFLGSIARIFTSLQETGDTVIVATYLVASFANFLLVAQLLYYWDATNKALAKGTSSKKPQSKGNTKKAQ